MSTSWKRDGSFAAAITSAGISSELRIWKNMNSMPAALRSGCALTAATRLCSKRSTSFDPCSIGRGKVSISCRSDALRAPLRLHRSTASAARGRFTGQRPAINQFYRSGEIACHSDSKCYQNASSSSWGSPSVDAVLTRKGKPRHEARQPVGILFRERAGVDDAHQGIRILIAHPLPRVPGRTLASLTG